MNSLKKFEDMLANSKVRTFDKYFLGPFLIWYGLYFKKNPKMARRLLVTAGIWQLYYSWNHYRQLPENLQDVPKMLVSAVPTTVGLTQI